MLSRDIVEIQTTSRQKPTLALTLHPWRTRRLCAITEHSFAKVNLALLERAVSAPLPGPACVDADVPSTPICKNRPC